MGVRIVVTRLDRRGQQHRLSMSIEPIMGNGGFCSQIDVDHGAYCLIIGEGATASEAATNGADILRQMADKLEAR